MSNYRQAFFYSLEIIYFFFLWLSYCVIHRVDGNFLRSYYRRMNELFKERLSSTRRNASGRPYRFNIYIYIYIQVINTACREAISRVGFLSKVLRIVPAVGQVIVMNYWLIAHYCLFSAIYRSSSEQFCI